MIKAACTGCGVLSTELTYDFGVYDDEHGNAVTYEKRAYCPICMGEFAALYADLRL